MSLAMLMGVVGLVTMAQAEVGWLTVRSAPEGLELRVDGEPVGRTPLERREASPGEHLVEVSGPCHRDARERVEVRAGEERAVVLVPEERKGVLLVSATDPHGRELEAVVAVDGLKVGRAPGGFEVPVCASRVLVSHPEQGSRWEDIRLEEGQTLVLDVVLDGTFAERPASGRETDAPEPRTWLLGLRAAALFDTGGALRGSTVQEESKVFETSTGILAELRFDFRPMENFFLGAWFGLLYARVRIDKEPDPDLVRADLGAHLGACVELIPDLELALRVGLGPSFFLEEVSRPVAAGQTAWKYDPGFAGLTINLSVGLSWFPWDSLGLAAEVGLVVMALGQDDVYDRRTLDYGPLILAGLGVLYSL